MSRFAFPPGGGSSSPLTTKGDLWGYSTVDARLPVGSNGKLLAADSSQSLGLKWTSPVYTELVWDSAGSTNLAPIFNSFQDLYDYKRSVLGDIGANIYVIQNNSTIPYYAGTYSPGGAYNFTGMTFVGNGGSVLLGSGILVFIANGVTISAWTPSAIGAHITSGIGFITLSSTPVINVSGFVTIIANAGSGFASSPSGAGGGNCELFNIGSGAGLILPLIGGSVLFGTSVGGYEVINTGTSGTAILAMAGSGTNVDSRTVRGTGTELQYVWSDASASTDPLTNTQTNFSGTTTIVKYPNSKLVKVDDVNYGPGENLVNTVSGLLQLIRSGKRRVQSTTTTTAQAIDLDRNDGIRITALASNITISTSGTAHEGQRITVEIKDDGTPRTITWPGNFLNGGAGLPTTTTANKWLHIEFVYNSSTSNWYSVVNVTEP